MIPSTSAYRTFSCDTTHGIIEHTLAARRPLCILLRHFRGGPFFKNVKMPDKDTLLELHVDGPAVHSGRITVPDLLTLCEHAQNAVARQAEAMEGRQSLRPGPKVTKVKDECTLELTGIGHGSTTLMFSLAKPQQHLPGVVTFAEEVIVEVTKTLKAFEKRKKPEVRPDPGVLDSLNRMGEVLEHGINRVEWIVPGRSRRKRSVKATITKTLRKRVAESIAVAVKKEVTIEGRLEMADFRTTDERCRIHPPVGNPIQCFFDRNMEDEIYKALRKTIRVTGDALINPVSGKTEQIAIRSIEPIDPLSVTAADFFSGKSLEELAKAQGIEPLRKLSGLKGGWPDDEPLDEFLDKTYRDRATG